MRSDVFGCNSMHFRALGSVPTLREIFVFFRFFDSVLVIFVCFLTWGACFYGRFTCRGLTFIGANYWEVALSVPADLPFISICLTA